MAQISLKIPEDMHHQVLLKMEALGMDNVSDTIRYLLRLGLDNDKGNPDVLQKKALSYAIMSYCLIEESILSLTEEGSELSDRAHAKAEKLINSQLINSRVVFE